MTAASLAWRELHFLRPLDANRCVEVLRRIATGNTITSNGLVIEARGHAHTVRYLIGAPPSRIDDHAREFTDLLPQTRVTLLTTPRRATDDARRVVPSTRDRRLAVEEPSRVARAVLAALARAGRAEVLTLQIVIHRGRRPALQTPRSASPTQPLWSVLLSGPRPLSSDEARAARDKHAEYGFDCQVRIGVTARTVSRRRALLGYLLAALRTMEPAGLRLNDRPAAPAAIDQGQYSAWAAFWSTSSNLSIHEVLAVSAWPVGDNDLPGVPPLHPRRLAPTRATRPERVIGGSTAPGLDPITTPLAQSVSDALRHRHVLGPSGVGKSVLLGHLIGQDIAAEQPVVVIEPKGDLVDDIIKHLPAHRHRDVVILDPTDPSPLGLNPLALTGQTSAPTPEVAAESVLAIFKDLYADSWGPRTQDIMHACLLSLTRWSVTQPGGSGATLPMVPLLLTNPSFRRRVIRDVGDPVALDSFWHWYESISDAERAAAIAPVMNKLRAWLYHPGLRAILGQHHPRFSVREIFTGTATERAPIFLVPLRAGLIGREAARLIGSLVVAQVWHAIQARTAVPERDRRPVGIYIDECQEYVRLTTDIGDALATARGLGCSFTLAHQYLHQLPTDLRSGVLANARSRICFQLGADDATVMAKGHPETTPEDFTSLEPYEFQASLVVNHHATPYASGHCTLPGRATSTPSDVRRPSRDRYGVAATDTEAELLAFTEPTPPAATPTGRRTRPQPEQPEDQPTHGRGSS